MVLIPVLMSMVVLEEVRLMVLQALEQEQPIKVLQEEPVMTLVMITLVVVVVVLLK
jgi:hypothetical protein